MMRITPIFLAALTLCSASQTTHANDNWREAANERIQQHRQSDVEVLVLDAAGKPLEGATVTLEMQAHAFIFGAAINAKTFEDAPEDGPYREHFKELFNTAVLENSMKWKSWEKAANARERTDEVEAWLRVNDIALRGHTMVWQCSNFGVTYPKDIEHAIAGEMEDGPAWIRERTANHIANVGTYFHGKVIHWDVINELSEWSQFNDYLTPDANKGESPDVAEWFRLAKQADPNALLYINDYHILVGDFTKQKDTYETIIHDLLEQGAPVEAIGFQGHFYGKRLTRTPDETYATLERFAKFGLPMSVTEFDTFGKGWGETQEERDANKAEYLEEFLTTCFSHPQMNAFVFWGYWDGKHWAKDAPFFREDWSPKPALEVYKRLVFDEWWTKHVEAKTNAKGVASFRVFHGDYHVSIEDGDKSSTLNIKVVPSALKHTAVLPKKD